MASQLIIPRQLDANGDPVSGAKANVYQTGTSTPVTVYTDTGLSVAHANPIVSDGEGYFAQAFYGLSTALRVVVTDSADVTLVTYDPVPLVSLSGSAASDVTHTPSTGNPATNVQDALDNLADGSGFEAGAIGTTDLADDAVTDAKILNPSACVFISSTDLSAASEYTFTAFDASKYDFYELRCANLVPATDAVSLSGEVSTNGGSSYITSGYTRVGNVWQMDGVGAGSANNLDDNAAATAMSVSRTTMGSDAGEDGWSGTITIYGPHLTKSSLIHIRGFSWTSDGGATTVDAWQTANEAAVLNGIRLYMSSGNIESGTVTVYGYRNS
jgi:hypothetical protein